MKKYNVQIFITLAGSDMLEIMANSEEEARELAEEQLCNYEVDFSMMTTNIEIDSIEESEEE